MLKTKPSNMKPKRATNKLEAGAAAGTCMMLAMATSRISPAPYRSLFRSHSGEANPAAT